MNYYVIILLLVLLGGIGVTIWGWKILLVSRKMSQWPAVEGEITKSNSAHLSGEFSPNIQYHYVVNGKGYQRDFEFPRDVESIPELSASYIKKYPMGKKVTVYYNTSNPDEAVLEPTLRGDWMILVLGLVAIVAAVLALLS
ncbi:MAG: DUF3592 domain-containing protein [Gammaproteobacteria bacterium]|nr:DUF3592 domain-containing protein [Gammaproteobacteria bacterium]